MWPKFDVKCSICGVLAQEVYYIYAQSKKVDHLLLKIHLDDVKHEVQVYPTMLTKE